MEYISDNIAAVATASGGALGVVRVSGPDAKKILSRVFHPRHPEKFWPPFTLRLGRALGPDGEAFDEVLAVHFKAPHSFTGEDAAEIQGHGGAAGLAAILRAFLAAGARLAEPGEFTLRAFLNGRLDLSQAEAVSEIVAAKSDGELRLAARQLGGGLREKIEAIQRAILENLAQLEAGLDFAEDAEDIDLSGLRDRLQRDVQGALQKLLEARAHGRVFRDGLKLAVLGAPNVGKSSLFNALLNQNRAIVSHLPGATRDFLSAEALWGGLRIELLDTAGLSEIPRDELDALGQARAREEAKDADFIIWLRDASRPQLPDALGEFSSAAALAVVWNKADLAPEFAPPEAGRPAALVSAKTGAGLSELRGLILEALVGRAASDIPEIVPNLRQQKILEGARDFIRAAIETIEAGAPPEITALELTSALNSIGLISGQSTPDDVLKEIFSRFCLGK